MLPMTRWTGALEETRHRLVDERAALDALNASIGQLARRLASVDDSGLSELAERAFHFGKAVEECRLAVSLGLSRLEDGAPPCQGDNNVR